MKTLKQFEEMAPEFRNTLKGYKGELRTEFFEAVELFMSDHDFEEPIASILYEEADGTVIFFSDHPLNDSGFVYQEFHDIRTGTRVATIINAGSKERAKLKIDKAIKEAEEHMQTHHLSV